LSNGTANEQLDLQCTLHSYHHRSDTRSLHPVVRIK